MPHSDLPAALAALFGAGALAVAGFCACSSDGGAASTPGGDGGTEAAAVGTGDPKILVGTFALKADPQNGSTAAAASIVGKIYDGPTPSDLVWLTTATDGACTLLTPKVPFCSTPCGSSKACVDDEKCQAYPTAHGAGSVKATGIKTAAGGAELTMSPVANTYQAPAGTALAFPPFAEGDDVKLDAAGDYFQAFSVSSKGILPIALTSTDLKLDGTKALALRWTAGKAGLAKILVKLDISHHGGTKGKVECEADDTGSLDVAATLVDKLIKLGVAGFPTVVVTRQAVGSAVIAQGRVDLKITSTIETAVTIDGLQSCTDTTQCPQGKTCAADLTCK